MQENDLEGKIEAGETVVVSRRVERLRSLLEARRKRPQESQETRRQLVRLSAEDNRRGAKIFVENLRKITPKIIRSHYSSYESNEHYAASDVVALADRWLLPILLIRTGGVHWILALREPERISDGWRVLVYDPMRDHEGWFNLQSWDSDYSDPNNILRNLGYVNGLGLEDLRSHTYDLSLREDTELAADAELYEAKQTRVQPPFNVIDCGPLCLFAAALRSGAKKGWNQFKFAGRDILRQDTGVEIQTREEFLGQPAEGRR